MADLFDRSLGVGYTGGSSILLACVLCSLAAWYLALGSVNVQTVATPKVEAFYWMTITFSQTLGTALGDWVADAGLGYEGGALVFGAGLAVLVAAYYWTNISHVVLFWAAFILTRPLGATVGDFLDKPVSQGGLHLSRPFASAVLCCVYPRVPAVAASESGKASSGDCKFHMILARTQRSLMSPASTTASWPNSSIDWHASSKDAGKRCSRWLTGSRVPP
ncbi:putative membrane-anchored protein [Bradyrhizobium sp. LB7.1]